MTHQNGRVNGLLSKIIILFLLLGGFALYTYQLDRQSIWRDEALSIGRAHQPVSLILQNRNIIQGVDSVDLHPPAYFLLLAGWRQLVGESEFAYRYFSVMAVMLNLALLSTLARRLADRKQKWLLATVVVFLGVLSPYYLWYAQEARMYSLVSLQMAMVLYTLWPCLQASPKFLEYVKLLAALVFLTLTHYTGAFVFAFVVAALIVTRLHWRTLVWIAAGGAAVLLLAIPFYSTVIELWGLFDLLYIQPRTLWEMFFEGTIIYHLGAAEALSGNDWQLWLIWALMGVGAAGFAQINHKRPLPHVLLTLGAFLGTFAVFYLSGFIKPNYVNPRHFMVLSVPYLLLLGGGVVWLYGRFRPLGLASLALVAWIAGSMLSSVVETPPQTKDDVRQIAAYLEKYGTDGDLVVWYDPSHSITYDYYAVESLPYVAYPPIYLVAGTDIHGEYQQILKEFEAERVWFIDTDNTPIDELAEWMEDNWQAQEFTTFPASWTGLYMTLYQQPSQTPPEAGAARSLGLTDMGVTLDAVELPQEPLTNGAWIDFYLSTADLPADAPTPDLCLRLKEKSGQEWSARCGPAWLSDDPPQTNGFKKQLWLEIPQGLHGTQYDLEILWGGETSVVGEVKIAGASPVGLPQVDFGGIAIQESSIINAELTPSSWLLTDVVWQLTRPWLPEEENLQAALRLVPRWGDEAVLQVDGLALGTKEHPASAWQPNDVTRQRLPLQIPATIEFGRYRLQIALQRADGSYLTSWTTLGNIDIEGWDLLTELPDTAAIARIDVPHSFDSGIELIGHEVQGDSGAVTIDLYWRATAEIENRWHTFVHWGEADAPPISQAGGVPVGNTRPTETWRDGEIIVDRYILFLPEGETFANYGLSVGFYNSDTGQRAPLTVNGTAVPSGTYRVEGN